MKKTTTIALSMVLAGGVLYGCAPAPKDGDEFKPRVVAPKTAKMNAAYKVYSEAAVPAGAPYVLFFHADWCPTCVAWEKSVNEATLPENAMILKVNYDEAVALKEQYGIKKQSTAVMIDAEGNVVATAADPSMEDVAAFFTDYAVEMDASMETEMNEEMDTMEEEMVDDMEMDDMDMMEEGGMDASMEVEMNEDVDAMGMDDMDMMEEDMTEEPMEVEKNKDVDATGMDMMEEDM